MPNKYNNLLSPIKVGNVMFKNRLTATRSSPRFVQGSETYPTEALITHYSNKAKNGAALVTCDGVGMPHYVPDSYLASFSSKSILPGGFNIHDEDNCQHYLAQLTEAIHFYGSKASMQIGGYVPIKYDVSTGTPALFEGESGPRLGQEIPADMLDEIADDFALQASMLKMLGFDMVYLHMAYRLTILGRFLSPLTNKRTDQYGGSVENRAHFPIMVADRIKQKCGRDFLIEASISGCETQGGITLEDAIEYAKMFAGHIDLLQIRAGDIDPAHPTSFSLERTPFLPMAEAIKKSGADIKIVTVGGYQDLDICEDVIASGKADFIGMARSWISNPDYGLLAYEGRNGDIIPCLRCNACLRSSSNDPPISVCAVNPVWGIEHRINNMIKPPNDKKKIAIIGGGPAGMKAALIATSRGHDVTLYEKDDVLGGLLNTVDDVSFKWPQKNFKDYLIRQIKKSGAKIYLNTEATPEILEVEGYDAILAAVGSEPIIPPIPGIDNANVIYAQDVYGNENTVAKTVVIVGGGEVGVETGMYLAERGHKVTLLEMTDMLASSAPPSHYYSLFKEAWERQENFTYILLARCTGIRENEVKYISDDSIEHVIEAGSVVIAVGMKSKNELALIFYGISDRFYMIGDCDTIGNIRTAMKSAFSTASML